MTDPTPELDPEVMAAAADVKDARVQTRLVYAEDLVKGMVVVVPKKCPKSDLVAVILDSHDHGVEEQTLLEVRTAGDAVSCILLDEEGEQQPLIAHRMTTVRVAVNR